MGIIGVMCLICGFLSLIVEMIFVTLNVKNKNDSYSPIIVLSFLASLFFNSIALSIFLFT